MGPEYMEDEFDEIEIIDLSDKEKDNITKKQKNRRRRVGKRKILLASIVISMFLALVFTFSWYRFSKDNHAETKDAEIMTPYFLYLVNPDDTTTLRFSVGNIHPGEVKQIVVCVSNRRPDDDDSENNIDIARISEFNYDLEFIHTDNLKVDYDIYELEKTQYEDASSVPGNGILVEGVPGFYWTKKLYEDNSDPDNPVNVEKMLEPTYDATSERLESVFGPEEKANNYADIFNTGTYIMYQKDGNGKDLSLKYENAYEYDYYLIEISWQDGINFSEYTKETDLVYIIVNAKQPKPLAIG